MKRLICFLSIVAFLFIVPLNSFSQNWSEDQLEVWSAVKKSWDAWLSGDIDAFMSCLHEDYQGWSNLHLLPVSKTLYREMNETEGAQIHLKDYFINPARIVVSKNAAVVHYGFDFNGEYVTEKEIMPLERSGKNADFYVKEGGEWLLLGDMTFIKGMERDDD